MARSRRHFGMTLAGATLCLMFLGGCSGNNGDELLNVSYDPTRELWKDLSDAFIEHHEKETGKKVRIKPSHGGSGSQARAVIDGLEADVVTLALWTDVDAIRKKGLIDDGWQKKLPHDSLPYYSTIGFVTNSRASSSVPPERMTDAQAASRLSLPLPDVFGLGVTIFTSELTRSFQSLMPFGLPLRTTKTMVE